MSDPDRQPLPADDPRHGTPSAYVYHRCRCTRCRAASKAAEDARNAAREPLASDDPRHGTSKGYKTARCREPWCRAWNAAAAAARKAGEPVPQRVPEPDPPAYRPGDDCQSCGIPARECGHVRPEDSR